MDLTALATLLMCFLSRWKHDGATLTLCNTFAQNLSSISEAAKIFSAATINRHKFINAKVDASTSRVVMLNERRLLHGHTCMILQFLHTM